MKHNLKAILLSSVSLCIIVVITYSLTSVNSISTSTNTSDVRKTIIIDPGHGGFDSGAVVDNILEKNINMQISLKLKDLFLSNGFKVVMTRNKDIALYTQNDNKKRSDLNTRVKLFNSNENNIVISIHQNMFTDCRYSGTQVFFSNNNADSSYLAECIRNSVVTLIQPENKRQCKKAGSEIFVLDNSTVPAVMVECGFMSNVNELNNLTDDKYQNKLAYSIYLGFLEFYYTNY